MQYATAAEYRVRVGRETGTDDALLDAQIEAISRLLDAELSCAPGYFAPHDATYEFVGSGSFSLQLRDDAGLAYGLRTVADDGIVLQFHGSSPLALSLTDVTPRPANALKQHMPYTSLELNASSPTPNWPDGGTVTIEGGWGWPETPGPILELVCSMCRDMRDSQRGGLAARIQVFDDVNVLQPDTLKLWNVVKRRYGRYPPLRR